MSKQLTTKQILEYTEAQQNNEKPENNVLILDVGQSLRSNAKMTPEKRVEFFDALSQEFNITKACAKVGISHQAFLKLNNKDAKFNAAFEQVKFAWLHQQQAVSFKVGCDPTHKGYNDRRLNLQAYLKEYNPKQEIDIKHTVTDDTYLPEIRRILSQYVSSRDGAVEAKYTKCNDNNELEER